MKATTLFIKYIYEYAFYRLYRMGILFNKPTLKLCQRLHINLKLHVAFWCSLALALLLMLNITSIFFIIFGRSDEVYYLSKSPRLLILLLIALLNSIYFIRKKKYLDIERRFSNESLFARILSSLLLLLIVFTTFYFLK